MNRTDKRMELLDRAMQAEACMMLLLPESESEKKPLYALCSHGELVSPFPGMFARRAHWEARTMTPRTQWLHIIRTYVSKYPDRVLCGHSAALAYGLWMPYSALGKVHIAAGNGTHGKEGKHVVYHSVRSEGVAKVADCRVTPLLQTLFDCARGTSLHIALCQLDSALRFFNVTKEDLIAYAEAHGRGLHGRTRAMRAFSAADGRSENGGESLVRGLIIEKGYMPPTDLQHVIADPVDAGRTYRADQYWVLPDGREVVGEVDGFVKYSEEGDLGGRKAVGALVDERQRESHITAAGMPVMRFLYKRVGEPGYMERLLDAFEIPRVPR